MTAHTTMILFISMVIITTGGIMVFYEVTREMQNEGMSISKEANAENSRELELVNTVGTNIQEETFNYVKFQVKYEGKERLKLNDTFIQIRTEKSIADLQYRNGTLYRDQTSGFFTE